ncbi:MAG: hypothetical protein COB66_09310, partial [Coxiella sp. (in: Bacteria)]
VFIHLDHSQLNKARVNARVQQGGHDVPDTKIEQIGVTAKTVVVDSKNNMNIIFLHIKNLIV